MTAAKDDRPADKLEASLAAVTDHMRGAAIVSREAAQRIAALWVSLQALQPDSQPDAALVASTAELVGILRLLQSMGGELSIAATALAAATATVIAEPVTGTADENIRPAPAAPVLH